MAQTIFKLNSNSKNFVFREKKVRVLLVFAALQTAAFERCPNKISANEPFVCLNVLNHSHNTVPKDSPRQLIHRIDQQFFYSVLLRIHLQFTNYSQNRL